MQLSRQLSEISSEKQKTDNEIQNLQKELKDVQDKNSSLEDRLEESNKQMDEVLLHTSDSQINNFELHIIIHNISIIFLFTLGDRKLRKWSE